MNKYVKLLKNSGIFAFASIGSHLITFLLVRFYTELLSTEQYGIIDIIVTAKSLIIPIISLAIVESVLRFSIDDNRPMDVFVNGLFIAFGGTLFFFFTGFLFFHDNVYQEYFGLLTLLVFFTCIGNITAQYVRGIGKIFVFALSGVIKTLVLAGCNILFLWYFGWKINGYILSMIFSETITVMFLVMASKSYNFLPLHINKLLLKEMLKYSIPLIPTTLSWWAMNATSKYVILLYLGVSSNGLFAVAHKLPSFITLCNNLFFQAWQLAAVEESKSEAKAVFYSNVFNVLAMALFMMSALLLLFLKPMMGLLAAKEYSEAWRYTPFLIIGMVFAAFSSFLGTNYVAMKKTYGALKTTIVGAIVNIILNFLFIRNMGINGAGFATMISFGVIWAYRSYDTRNFVSITYKKIPLVISICTLILQSIAMIMDCKFAVYTGIGTCFLILLLYKPELSIISSIFYQFLRRKTNKMHLTH